MCVCICLCHVKELLVVILSLRHRSCVYLCVLVSACLSLKYYIKRSCVGVSERVCVCECVCLAVFLRICVRVEVFGDGVCMCMCVGGCVCSFVKHSQVCK